MAPGNVVGIEKIDLTGSGNNSLALTAQDVLDLSDTDTLIVTGDAGDSVASTGLGWIAGGTEVIGTETYNKFTVAIGADTATLLVDADMTASAIS